MALEGRPHRLSPAHAGHLTIAAHVLVLAECLGFPGHGHGSPAVPWCPLRLDQWWTEVVPHLYQKLQNREGSIVGPEPQDFLDGQEGYRHGDKRVGPAHAEVVPDDSPGWSPALALVAQLGVDGELGDIGVLGALLPN